MTEAWGGVTAVQRPTETRGRNHSTGKREAFRGALAIVITATILTFAALQQTCKPHHVLLQSMPGVAVGSHKVSCKTLKCEV